MRPTHQLTIFLLAALPIAGAAQTLKETLGTQFLIGAAVDTTVTRGHNAPVEALVCEQFNSIVAENCMKGEEIHPEENRYYWDDADRTVQFAEEHNLSLTGHVLIWHSQPPKWMFTHENGDTVSRYVLIDRMYHHIMSVAGRYKGHVKGWDVVNEVLNDDGTFRQSPYYKIIGPDFVELAFRFAREADPEAELYINDYSLAKPAKRAAMCRLVRELQAKGCRVDAVGMQSHNGYDYPDLDEWEASIDSFAALGVKVMMTEMDVNMLPNPKSFGGAEISQKYDFEKQFDPYAKGLTREAKKLFDERYTKMFDIILRHRKDIARVTFWGASDANSWLNDWPIKGRTNYPLLFDRQLKAKPVVKKIIKMYDEINKQ